MQFVVNENIYWFSRAVTFTLLQFRYINFIENIPRFCYHEKLSVAGNCRSCLVEDVKSIKPIVSCTIVVQNFGSYYTSTYKVKKARESMLEFLLINHPLDRPICCQGGECDSQDPAELVGADRGRYYESKRAVLNKNLGPVVKTLMNRCIHCTRCVRFSSEIGFIKNLGVLGRGGMMEVGTYINEFLDSSYSGNLVDICPVGASTSKPYSYKARPWESVTSIVPNLFDVSSSDIRVDIRGGSILRILPVYNSFLNHEWLDNNTRYFYDSLCYQRLLYPMIIVSKYVIIKSWRCIFRVIRCFSINIMSWIIRNKFKYVYFFFLTGNTLSIRMAILIKQQFSIFSLKSSSFDEIKVINSNMSDMILNNVLSIFIICNKSIVKYPLLLLKIRQKVFSKNLKLFWFGESMVKSFLRFNYCDIFSLFEGKHFLSKYLKDSVVFSEWVYQLNLENFSNFLKKSYNICMVSATFNLPSVVSDIAKSHLSIYQSKLNYLSVPFVCYNIENDNILDLCNLKKGLLVYQGFIGDLAVQYSNIIMPVKFIYENSNNSVTDYYLSLCGEYKLVSCGMMNTEALSESTEVVIQIMCILELFTNTNRKEYLYIVSNNSKSYFCGEYIYWSKYITLVNLVSNREPLYLMSKILQKFKRVYTVCTWNKRLYVEYY